MIINRYSPIFCLPVILFGCAKTPTSPDPELIHAPANEPPSAHFSVLPDNGSIFTEFTFDAGASTDPDDPQENLRVYWNWGDGSSEWGAQGGYEKQATHMFSRPGLFKVKVVIHDPGRLTSTDSLEVLISGIEGWRVDLGRGRWLGNFEALALGSDGTIYAVTSAGNIFAVDSDGAILWSRSFNTENLGPPVVTDEGTIYLGVDTSLHALDSSGNTLWEIPIPEGILGSPTVGRDGTLYMGTRQGDLLALDSSGEQQWLVPGTAEEFWLNDSYMTILGDGNVVYFPDSTGSLRSLNSDGTIRWSYISSGYEMATHVVVADNGDIYFGMKGGGIFPQMVSLDSHGNQRWVVPLYFFTYGNHLPVPVIDPDGTIIVAPGSGGIYAFNSAGFELWNYPAQRTIAASPMIGSDGTIYTADHSGGIRAYLPDGTLSWHFDTDLEFYSAPVLGDHVIYCLDADGILIAVTCHSSGLAAGQWPRYRGGSSNLGR